MSVSILGFNGERLDPVSGATHLGNGYRAFYPALRRFNRPDSLSPFGHGGMNSYAYCAGDPINRADPSGHFSWQAGLSIGMGLLGILGAIFTAGGSLIAAGSLGAAMAASTVTTLAVGTAGVVADITSVASPLTAHSHPKAFSLLGWISLAAGLLSLGTGLTAGGYQLLNTTAEESSNMAAAAEHAMMPELPTAAATPTLERLSHNPLIMSGIMRRLTGTEIDNLRATSKTLQANVESMLTRLDSLLPERSSTEFMASYKPSIDDYSVFKSKYTNSDYIEQVRRIWRGEHPFTSASQLSKSNINPLENKLSMMRTTNIRRMLHPHSFQNAEQLEQIIISESTFNAQVYERNKQFNQWKTIFRSQHAHDFINN